MSIKTGIMGGTFDPIHYGHLLAAEECRRRLDIDRIVFVPTGSPPHKTDRRVTPAEDRYAMTLLATAGVPEFSVSRMEIERKRPTHTVDTLREFIAGGTPPEDLFFITGLDALLSIDTWVDYLLLPTLCTLVTATRPGYDVRGWIPSPKESGTISDWSRSPSSPSPAPRFVGGPATAGAYAS